MKSALSYLLTSENSREVMEFLRSRGPRAHIVAPAWVKERVWGHEPTSGSTALAHWSEEVPVLDASGPEKVNVFVIAEDAIRERAVLLSLGRRKGVKAYGLFGHIVPALLCSIKGIPAVQQTDDLKRYAIVCVPRSGSRYFSAVLSNMGMGAPKEHIREPLAHIIGEGKLGFNSAIAALERYGQKNGIFGTKLISTFIIRASRGRLSELKNNMAWLVERGYTLVRLERPLNETVVSSYIAFLMGQWHFFGEMNEDAKAKLDSLVFQDGAAWEEYVRFRAEQTIVNAVTRNFNFGSYKYSEIESDIERVVRQLCEKIGADRDSLETGSVRIPSVTRTESPTYGVFANRLEALLDRRSADIEPATIKKLRALAGLDQREAEFIAAQNIPG